MTKEVTQEMLDNRAQAIADLLDDLPWCDCTGFLIVEEDEVGEPDAALNQYLQAFDVLVFDGYVTDFMRMIRSLHQALPARFAGHTIDSQVTLQVENGEDPNLVPLSLMIHYYGDDSGYLSMRSELLDTFESIVRSTVEEWTQEEEDDEPVETLV